MTKILSIDFDYFQKASKEVLYMYPDGHDFGSELSMMIWSGHYMHPKERALIESVTVDRKKLEQVKGILKKQNPYSSVLVAQSHVHIAEFIRENVDSDDKVKIVNLDMHHDTFDKNGEYAKTFDEVDCGNWGSVILSQYPNSEITWVNQSGSSIFGKGDPRLKVEKDMMKAADGKFDMIFLCRSDIWTPPHLDPAFNELFETCCDTFKTVRYDPQIKEPRDMSVIEERIKAEREFFKKNFPEQYKRQFEEPEDIDRDDR